MMTTPINERAEALALDLHEGQPYYGTEGAYRRDFAEFHLRPGALAVRRLGGGPVQEAVFWLHDSVEDTGATLDDLREEGMPEDVVAGVELMTWWDGQTYEEYLLALKGEREAAGLKFVDSWRNLGAAMELRRHIGQEAYDIWVRQYAGNLLVLGPQLLAHGLGGGWDRFAVEQTNAARTILGEHRGPSAEGLLPTPPRPAFAS